MSKELEALDKIKQARYFVDFELDTKVGEDYKEEISIIEKSLKALEIIKEKPVVALVDYKYTYEEWLELVDERGKDLFKNKEEYDLLREVLNNAN